MECALASRKWGEDMAYLGPVYMEVGDPR